MNASNCSSEGMAHDEAFPVLNAAEIHVAEKFGRRERLGAGRVLFEPGPQLVGLPGILDGRLGASGTSGYRERIPAGSGTPGVSGEGSLLTVRIAPSFAPA